MSLVSSRARYHPGTICRPWQQGCDRSLASIGPRRHGTRRTAHRLLPRHCPFSVQSRLNCRAASSKMAILSANTMIRSISLFHLTLAVALVKNPALIANQGIVLVLGHSMQLVRVRPSNEAIPNQPRTLLIDHSPYLVTSASHPRQRLS